MNTTPYAVERVRNCWVLTHCDPLNNIDKVYVIEVIASDDDVDISHFRVRYGRNDGRKLRWHYKGRYTNFWAFTHARNLFIKKRYKGYDAVDELHAACIVAQDNIHHRVDQEEIGEPCYA